MAGWRSFWCIEKGKDLRGSTWVSLFTVNTLWLKLDFPALQDYLWCGNIIETQILPWEYEQIYIKLQPCSLLQDEDSWYETKRTITPTAAVRIAWVNELTFQWPLSTWDLFYSGSDINDGIHSSKVESQRINEIGSKGHHLMSGEGRHYFYVGKVKLLFLRLIKV